MGETSNLFRCPLSLTTIKPLLSNLYYYKPQLISTTFTTRKREPHKVTKGVYALYPSPQLSCNYKGARGFQLDASNQKKGNIPLGAREAG